jgi:adenosine kinase
MLEERTGLRLEQLAPKLKALILTRGAEGSIIYADGKRFDIPSAKAQAVVDPTGCGDAYRAGLLYGIVSGFDWAKSGRLASLMGAIKVASRGAQNHSVTRDEIKGLFRSNFGSDL